MSDKLTGSDLTRAILERGDKGVWCAVSNDSDKHAMTAISNADYHCLFCMMSFDNGYFVCKTGNLWQYAVPIKKVELTQSEVGL